MGGGSSSSRPSPPLPLPLPPTPTDDDKESEASDGDALSPVQTHSACVGKIRSSFAVSIQRPVRLQGRRSTGDDGSQCKQIVQIIQIIFFLSNSLSKSEVSNI